MADSTKTTNPQEGGGIMELQTFVTETLKQVYEGIKAAMAKDVRVAESSARDVDFDVALTVTELYGRKVGAGIFVAGLGLGGQKSTEGSTSAVSRVKFSVPVHFPGDSGAGV